MTSFNNNINNFENNPSKFIRKFIFWIIGLGIIFSSFGYVMGWFSEAAEVAQEEFGARASLEKYGWFKDASETLKEKTQTIKVYEEQRTELKNSYEGVKRKDWGEMDKIQYNQWTAEITGIKASYNKVVKEYNSQSSKFNWEGFNTTEVPKSQNLYMNN